MPTLGRGIPNIPPHPDTGGLGSLLAPPPPPKPQPPPRLGHDHSPSVASQLGNTSPPLGHDHSPSVASQLGNKPIQRALNALPATRQSLGVSSQLEEQRKLNSNERNQSSCSEDLVERLVFAETMAQRTVQGTVTNALKAEEKRMSLYLDAGLLGIDYDEMMERRKSGQSEECILEEHSAKLRRKRDPDDNDGDKKMRAAEEPPAKKQRLVSHVQDSDALSAVGAMIQLQRQKSSDCETETESESDYST